VTVPSLTESRPEHSGALGRQLLVITALVVMLATNILANALPLNNQTTGAISARFPIYFEPAGYVFSIWGIIYLGLIVYAVYQALPAQRQNPRLRAIAYPFIFSCLANTTWLFLWHYNRFTLTQVAMVALLLALIIIYRRLAAGRPAASTIEKWAVHLPFSVYLGWVTVATVANTSIVLYDWGWRGGGLGEPVWAVLMLLVTAVLTFLMLWRHGDVAYALVIVWAAAGIAVKQSGSGLVAGTAIAVVVLVAVATAASLVTKRSTLNVQR
jgi:translocator protein